MEKYSVLMSVYYKEQPDFLRSSMESIFSQTEKTDDFILVCDGPLTKELDEVINEFEHKYDVLHVIRFEKNRGLGPALNDGIEACKNELIARMDSDDIAPDYRCQHQIDAFRKDSELVILGGTVEEFEGNVNNIVSKKQMPTSDEEIKEYAKLRSPFNHPTVMYKKSAVQRVGGYPPLYLHEDYGLWVRLLSSGVKAANLSETLCFMRVDSGLYSRRGGIKYLKAAVDFRVYLYKTGYNSFFKMLFGVLVVTVMCLVPTCVRKFIYGKFLRKKGVHNGFK